MPGELDDLREGYRWRREQQMKDLATVCATIMNSSGRYKRRISPADLLQKPKPKWTETRTAAERAAELTALKKSMSDGGD